MGDTTEQITSPVSDYICHVESFGYYRLFQERFGKWWCISDLYERVRLNLNNAYDGHDVQLSPDQVTYALALFRTKVWLAGITGLPPMFLHLDGVIEDQGYEKSSFVGRTKVQPTDMGRLHSEATKLSFVTRAYYTLYNIYIGQRRPGWAINVPYDLTNYPGSLIDPSELLEGHLSTGMIYGTPDHEAPMILRFLHEQNWVRLEEDWVQPGWAVGLTTDGLVIADKMARGLENRVQKAFCVCRFIPELDTAFEKVYEPVGREVNCPVQRVDRIHHNEVITDRILREIREATVIVVDLTESNFNVGFEAGYAMHLNKQIIFTIKKPAGNFQLPFDIAGYNTIIYEDLEKLREVFRERMLVAIAHEKAKSQLPSPDNLTQVALLP